MSVSELLELAEPEHEDLVHGDVVAELVIALREARDLLERLAGARYPAGAFELVAPAAELLDRWHGARD